MSQIRAASSPATHAWRIKLSVLFLIAATGLGLAWALGQGGSSFGELARAWRSFEFSPVLPVSVLALSGAVYLADAFRYQVFGRIFGATLSYRTCLRVSIGCLLFSWISPGASLGAPAATGLLMEAGVRWDDALLISFGKSLSSSLLLLLVSILLIALGQLPGGARSGSSVFLFACLAIYIAMLATPPLRKRLRQLLASGPRALSWVLLSNALYFGALIGILAVLVRALGAAGLVRPWAVSSLFVTLLYMSPTPAGAGVAEATAVSFFGGLVGATQAVLAVLLFRSVTYYAQIAFGASYFLVTGGRDSLRAVLRAETPQPREEPIDWAGKWFALLEELGEFARIPFGRMRPGSPEPEWVFLPHESFDGVGGLAHLLREEGYRIERLPVLKDPRPPGPLGAVAAYVRGQFSENRPRYMPWKSYDPSRPGRFLAPAWHRFTEDESRRIAEGARKLGVSTNSLLFHALDQAILPLFARKDFERRWMIPVNMRGAVTRGRETANQSSFIGVSVPAGASAQEVHRRIHREIGRHSHWGNWWSIQSGRLLGVQGMRRVLEGFRRRGNNWAGLFSNLGEWPLPGTEPEGDGASDWVLAVTVTQGHPVGGGCLTWKGRIGLSLTFHPSLGLEPREFGPYLEAWKAGILSCAGS